MGSYSKGKMIVSDLECCWKYRHTLPSDIELIGNFESKQSLLITSTNSISKKSFSICSEQPSIASVYGILSECSNIGEPAETYDDFVEDVVEDLQEIENVVEDDSESSASSICSEWIVLKPHKKKKAEIPKLNSVFDLNEPAGNVRLLKRPPSPDGEVFENEPKSLIMSNALKYENAHPSWPEPPSLEESLMKRAPSPNMSLPCSREYEAEVPGEDWIWIGGRYLATGEGEGIVATGEDGEYYRLPKQFIEGRWEPSPQLLEKWEREESAVEKEKQKTQELTDEYNKILKREDSPGMDVINWGDGPVLMMKWREFIQESSVQELSRIIPQKLFEKFLDETSKLSFEIREALTRQLKVALMDTSSDWIRWILNEHLSQVLSEEIAREVEQFQFMEDQEEFECHELCEAEFSQTESVGPTISGTWDKVVHQPLEVPANGDIIPQAFRSLLVGFIRQFRDEMPEDVLEYAINYFETIQPADGKEISPMTKSQSVPSVYSLLSKCCNIHTRRMSICTQSMIPESAAMSYSQNTFEKTEEEVDVISRGLITCFMFQHLGITGYTDMIRNMYRLDFSKGEVIIEEGETSPAFYVVQSGVFELSSKIPDRPVKRLKKYDHFGETCLIGETPSPYTAVALEDSTVWCLFGEMFRYMSISDEFQRRNSVDYLMNTKLEMFQKLNRDEKQKILDCVECSTLKKGEVIYCFGAPADGLHMIVKGVVQLVTFGNNDEKPSDVKIKKVRGPSPLNEAEFIYENLNASTCIVASNLAEVAVLKSDVFDRLIGDISDVMNRSVASSVNMEDFQIEELLEFWGEPGHHDVEEWQEKDALQHEINE